LSPSYRISLRAHPVALVRLRLRRAENTYSNRHAPLLEFQGYTCLSGSAKTWRVVEGAAVGWISRRRGSQFQGGAETARRRRRSGITSGCCQGWSRSTDPHDTSVWPPADLIAVNDRIGSSQHPEPTLRTGWRRSSRKVCHMRIDKVIGAPYSTRSLDVPRDPPWLRSDQKMRPGFHPQHPSNVADRRIEKCWAHVAQLRWSRSTRSTHLTAG